MLCRSRLTRTLNQSVWRSRISTCSPRPATWKTGKPRPGPVCSSGRHRPPGPARAARQLQARAARSAAQRSRRARPAPPASPRMTLAPGAEFVQPCGTGWDISKSRCAPWGRSRPGRRALPIQHAAHQRLVDGRLARARQHHLGLERSGSCGTSRSAAAQQPTRHLAWPRSRPRSHAG